MKEKLAKTADGENRFSQNLKINWERYISVVYYSHNIVRWVTICQVSEAIIIK